jgi:hypothetical protein
MAFGLKTTKWEEIMLDDRNRTSVLRQLAALEKMKLAELQEKWRDLYGTEPPHFKSSFLKKRLAYRIQELFYGGISMKAKEQIAEIAESDPLLTVCDENEKARLNARSGKILPGTRFVREWKGEHYEVIARENGFEYDGRPFRSLSAVATEITGTKWNGKLFFGVSKRKRKSKR